MKLRRVSQVLDLRSELDSTLEIMKRTKIIDTVAAVDSEVIVCGWVHIRRNFGQIVFLDLRDRSGLLQLVAVPKELDQVSLKALEELRPEFVIQVRGMVQKRGAKQINKNIPTGQVELLVKEIKILNASKTPPFEISNEELKANEELRLKYRYLDLRHERMQKNLDLRHRLIKFLRDYLHAQGFIEVETPILTKGTPEGAREFIVPSRLHPETFYALPQSPQQFKQLLMVAGLERYFQIARCFRDEDQRGDRQPEFTQLDLEMSFVEREAVMELNEELLIKLIKAVAPEKKIQEMPFPRLSYKEAIEKYGTDRPDLRDNKNDKDSLAFCWMIDFPFFKKGDDGRWTFTHNPFSAPVSEHRQWLLNKERVGEILTTQYDVALNGFEIAGGSIRNHEAEALAKVFEIMGIDAATIHEKFGHMLEAFAYGAPPHGGIAWGLDRLVAILAGEPNIREVIAFPKTSDARDLMMEAPSPVDQKALDEVHIQIKKSK